MTGTTKSPRTQHWTTGPDGFRVSVMVYKTNRDACAACGKRPALHSVWADGRGLRAGFSASPTHFCDDHRPPKGPLPPLDYQRLVRGGDVVIYEHLAAGPEHGCATCGAPGVFQVREQCAGCDDPARYATRQLTQLRPEGVTEHPPERFHVTHDRDEWWTCASHTPAGRKAAS